MAADLAGCSGGEPHGRNHQGDPGGDGVHAPGRREGQRRPQDPPAPGPLAGQHQGQQHPGRDRHRPDLDGRDGHLGQEARAEGVQQRSDVARPRVPHSQRARQPPHTEEPDREDRGPPQPLDHPFGHACRTQRQVERPHGEQVPVRLVLQLPECTSRVPHVQGPRQEPPGVLGQVELGVGYHHARRPAEGNGSQQEDPGQEAQAPEHGLLRGPGRGDGG